MNISVVTPPAVKPITLAEAKRQLRVEFDDEDAHIETLIAAATELCESYQGRAFIERTLRRTLDCFPSSGIGIVLPYPPLITVVEIKYDDEAGDEQTLATDQYQFDVTEVPARVRLAPGVGLWPATELQAVGSVRIDYTAGYGDSGASVPEATKLAIKIKLSDLYENRESIAPGSMTQLASVAAESLLAPDLVQWQGD